MHKNRFVRFTGFTLLLLLLAITVTIAQDDAASEIIADFEVEELFLGKDANNADIGFVEWGDVAGNAALSLVTIAEGDELALPGQSGDNTVLRVDYEISSFGGFSYLFNDGEAWTTQDWSTFANFDFWYYGNESGRAIQVELFDNRAAGSTSDSAERFFYRFDDDFDGWQFIRIPLSEFERRSDWQPSGAPNDGFGLIEMHGYAFAFPNGTDMTTTYIDDVSLSGQAEVEEEPEQRRAATLADFEVDELLTGQDENGFSIGFVPFADTADNVTLTLLTVGEDDDLAVPRQDEENTVLQVDYEIGAFGGFSHVFNDGEAWVAQDWSDLTTFDFWYYGTNSGMEIQVDLFDNRAEDATTDSAERWFYRFPDDFDGWQFIRIPFIDFQRRTDFQPGGAPDDGLGLTEMHGYAFIFPAGTEPTTTYIDTIGVSIRSGNVEPIARPTPTPLPPVEGYNYDGEWELFWSDEFDAGAGEPINDEFWTCEVGGWGWGNAQAEHNTDRTENVVHTGDGTLAIIAREEEFEGNEYTSGRCNTNDKFEFTYGRVEARIDLPEGQGIWPAFWMLGADFPDTMWPDSGEIDIMEFLGHELGTVHGTVHGPGYSGGGGIGQAVRYEESLADDFHVFGIEWEPNVIRWYVDGEEYFQIDPTDLFGSDWVFNDPFFMLINVAVGGNWPGYPDDTTVFPQEMLIDWIRVYQRGEG